MPGLDAVSFLSPSAMAGVSELTVSSLANPTELNSLGVAVPDWRLCKTVGAATDDATWYRLDASTDSVSAPYIMASATAGLRWVAVAGRYGGPKTLAATFADTSGSPTLLATTMTASPSGSSSANFYASSFGLNTSGSQNFTAADSVFGGDFSVNHFGTGTCAQAYGAKYTVNQRAGSGQLSNATALSVVVQNLHATVPIVTATGLSVLAFSGGGGGITTAYGIRVNNQTGATTNYALFTGTGLVNIGDTTEATSVSVASQVNQGGLGVVKRSFLGTIGSAFKGNVLAGVQDATAASAGQVGEVLSSTVTGVAVAGTGAVGNITSLSITAGDWLISAHATISGGATGLTAGSVQKLSIVTTTATNGTEGDTMQTNTVLALSANGKHALAIPQIRINISATTTYYLTEEVTFGGGSPTAAGKLIATRIR